MLILKKYFMLFIIYSFLGWLMEVIWTYINNKKIVNRGFLLGPYCPIYGCGCILLILLLNKFKSNPILLFFTSIIICSILEYLTSYLMEKLFKARWWDYTHYKFNLNGRICAETMIPFGVLGVLVVYYLNPFFEKNINISNIIFYAILIIFTVDNIISFGIIESMKNTISKVDLDNTEEITKKIKEILLSKSPFYKRLIKAFPTFKSPLETLKRIVLK